MTKVETQERTIEQVEKELREAEEAESRLVEEQQRLVEQRESLLDSDDASLLQQALSGRLHKNSAMRQSIDREAELPSLIHVLRHRAAVLRIERARMLLPQMEEEAQAASEEFFRLDEQLQQLQAEREWQQSISAGAAEDVKDQRRSIATLEQQLREIEANKPSADRFEALLAQRKVWRQ